MSRKLRLLIVSPTGGRLGGVEAFSIEIARQVHEDPGFEVRLVFRLQKGWTIQPEFQKWLATEHPFPTKIYARPTLRILADLAWSEIVNCHFPLIDVAIPTRLLRRKLFLSIENRRLPVHNFLHRIGMACAHRRWYISDFVRRTWEGDRRMSDSSVVPAVSDLPTQTVPIDHREGFILIARWVPQKGLEELIDAFSMARIDHSAHPLTLVGEGPLHEMVSRQISESKVKKFIRPVGFVNSDEKSRLLASAKWNVAPAQFEEDLGLTPIEARACGVPSIVTKIGGLPEAAGPAAILCEPFSVPALQRAVERAAEMPREEYVDRCELAKSSLAAYLAPADFYQNAFRDNDRGVTSTSCF